jgi:hypothetical protein
MQVNAGKGNALSTPKPSASIPGQWRFIAALIAILKVNLNRESRRLIQAEVCCSLYC